MSMTTPPASVRQRLAPWLLLGLLPVLMLLALGSGSYSTSLPELWAALLASSDGGDAPAMLHTLLWQVRLPRVLAAVLLGASLASAGALYQGVLRNPLVSPDILGVSAGAGLGAVLAMLWGWPLAMLQLSAFAGGLLAVLLVYLVSSRVAQRDPLLVLVLAGIAVTTVLGAGVSLVKVLADPHDQLPAITWWLLGSLNGVSLADLQWALPVILLALLPLWLLRWRINLLGLPDEEAASLGLNVQRLRWMLIALATLLTAAVVAFSGMIGWVGLVIPHLARFWVGPDFSRLLPVSLLMGACFVVLVDTLARTLAPGEIPLGVLTALLGGPFLIWVLLRSARS